MKSTLTPTIVAAATLSLGSCSVSAFTTPKTPPVWTSKAQTNPLQARDDAGNYVQSPSAFSAEQIAGIVATAQRTLKSFTGKSLPTHPVTTSATITITITANDINPMMVFSL